MIRYVRLNIQQLETVFEQATTLNPWQSVQIESKLAVAKEVLGQQVHMATTRGRQVANRIVSFHWPEVRPVVRGKEGKAVEFGPKAHVGIIDGYAVLEHASYTPFHEGNRLAESVTKHAIQFDREPDCVLGDGIYANRSNRTFLEEKEILHCFKQVGRPPNLLPEEQQKQRRTFRKRQGERNHVEATFGHLKSRFNLDRIKWWVPGGETIQIQLGLIAFNLHTAVANA